MFIVVALSRAQQQHRGLVMMGVGPAPYQRSRRPRSRSTMLDSAAAHLAHDAAAPVANSPVENHTAMMHGFHLDPHSVLGVAQSASAQDIREAYRTKTKKHHPDHGGDEWAFRVVVRAYEILSAMPPAPASAPLSAGQPTAQAARPGGTE